MPTENELEAEASAEAETTEEVIETAPFSLNDFLASYSDKNEQREVISYFKSVIREKFEEIKGKAFVTEADKNELLEQKEYFSQLVALEKVSNDVESLSLDDLIEDEPVVEDSSTVELAVEAELEADEVPAADTTAELSDDTEDKEAEDAVETEEALSVKSDESNTQTLTEEVSVDETNPNKENQSMSKLAETPKGMEATASADDAKEAFTVVASDGAAGFAPGQTIPDQTNLAVAILDTYDRQGGRRGWNFGSNVANDYLKIATVRSNDENQFAIRDLGDAAGNRKLIDDAISAHQATIDSIIDEEGLVASGGICAPAPPSYDFFRLAVPQNPVERALPALRLPRGVMRYLVPPSFRDITGGISTITCAEDAAGYVGTPAECGGPGPTPNKDCVCVTCPDVAECCVTAVSQCVRWGNFNYYTFPEQVEAFMQDMAVNFAITKEQLYMDVIHNESIAATSGAAYGASKDLFWDWQVAAVSYRYRNHMPLDATLDIFVPSWALDAIKIDLANNSYSGADYMSVTDAQVLAAFRSRNLRPTFYYDGADNVAAPDQPQAPGALNQFPTEMVSYLFAPGTFVRITAFELDFGIVRDHILNSTNDLTMFMEETTNVCKVGLESIAITHTGLCSGGHGGGAVTPICDSNGI